MSKHYAVYVGAVLMVRTKTYAKAERLARRWALARIVPQEYVTGVNYGE